MPKQFGIEEITERECPMCHGVMHRVEPTDGTRRYFRCDRCTHTIGRTSFAFTAVLILAGVILVGMALYIASEFFSSITAGGGGASLG